MFALKLNKTGEFSYLISQKPTCSKLCFKGKIQKWTVKMKDFLKGSEWNSGAQWNHKIIPAGMSKKSKTRDKMSGSGEKSGTSVPTPMLRFRRDSEVGNRDLCLFPPPHSMDLFSAPQNVEQANQSLLQNPFPGFHSPIWENTSPVFRSPSTRDYQQQQQDRQLTIFYGGTVNVYDVSPDLAEAVMVLANSESSSTSSFAHPIPTTPFPEKISSMDHTDQSHPSITAKPANFPLARQNSLQHFLEKRNDRFQTKPAVHSHLHHN